MDIIFSCLADLTSFLFVRDDNDFEAIHSKRAVMDSSALHQILGSFLLEVTKDTNFMDVENEIKPRSSSSRATVKICAISDKLSLIGLFVETSSVNYRPADNVQLATQGKAGFPNFDFRSTLFPRDRRYFCPSMKCYRTPWDTKHIESNTFVNCLFHLDKTVSKKHMKNLFLLLWTKQPYPLPMR